MQERIYQVTHKTTGTTRLVEAANPAQAMRYVAHDLYEVKPANARAVATLMKNGTTLEQSKEASE